MNSKELQGETKKKGMEKQRKARKRKETQRRVMETNKEQ